MWLAARARSGTLPVALALLGVLAVAGLLPLDPTLRYVVVVSMTWAMAAVGLDLFAGYLGQANFGQYAFVGLGAYGITILRAEAHLPVVVATLATLALTAAAAALLGATMVQLRHFGAALATFFLAFVGFNVLTGNALDPITHSETGLAVPPLSWGPVQFTSSGPPLYWLTWALLLGVVVATANHANSRSGRALRLVKQSELVAGTLGVRVRTTRLGAYVFSAVVAALAGLPLSLALGYLSPETFAPNQSINLFAMLVVGGIGSIAGPIIGAFFFTALPQELQSTGAAQALLFAVIFLVFVIAFPNGVYGLVEHLLRRVRPARPRRRHVPPEAAPATPGPAPRTHGDVPGRRSSGATDLRRPGTPSRGPASAVLAHPRRVGSLRSSAQDHDLGHLDDESLVDHLTDVLVAEGVAVTFGGVRALDGAGFSVREGTIHALVGPNGAGKTTFLNCVTGLQRAGAGTIAVDGFDVRRSPAHAVRARGVSRTFQNPSLVPDLTVLENVTLGLYGSHRWSPLRDLLGAWATARREREVAALAAAALRQVGLDEERWDVPAGDLSLGELKVVDVARAIAGGSRLLLLDEPTSGLGDADVRRIAGLLQRLRDEHGLTVLVVAHDVGFVQDISDAVTVLDFGRVIAHGAPAAVIEDPEVVTAFLGSPAPVAT